MITILNRRLNIPYAERLIAMDGDNLTNSKQFRIDGLECADWDFILDTKIGTNLVNPIALEKSVDATGITLTWNILSNQIDSGNVCVAIRAFKGNEVWQTNVDSFTVGESLNAASDYPSPIPSEFTQIEQTVTAAKNAAALSESNAKTSETNSTASELAASGSAKAAGNSAAAALASEGHAKTSEDNAKVSETNSKTSETTAAQALSDLLAMLGVDVATLVGGKVPISQIPATAICEIHEIASASELTLLTAQRGDLGEIVETINNDRTVTKTYQLLGTGDATMTDNWVVWGTSYAAQAGNATTATTATTQQ